MSYLDLTSTFVNKLLNSWQNGQQLVANDNYLYEMLRTYRRPNLVYVNSQFIDVENNVPTDPNATKIIFPDGDVRTVSEAVSLTIHKFRRLDRLSSFSPSPTYDSGCILMNSNTWFGIYAVKADDGASFVLAGLPYAPIAGNLATINFDLGANSWVYLGMVRTGDNASVTDGWLNFVQDGRKTMFLNTVASNSGYPKTGVQLATTSASSPLTYTYVNGMSGADIPDHIILGWYGASTDSSISSFDATDSAGAIHLASADVNVGAGGNSWNFFVPVSLGLQISGSNHMDIYFTGWIDHVLGVAGNPQL